jgi:predicted component of type VI protein secretion system
VPAAGVSRQHCELVVAADTVTVRDLDSSNGTYVNGERVEQKTIAAGDQIQVGAVLLTVQIDGQPADLAPPEARAQSPADGIGVDLAGDEDEVFAQMMMDDDDDDDDDSISALELLEDED